MQDEPTLKFHGGMFMSLIPVVIYALVCATLFIYFKAFNMEALVGADW